MPWKDWTLGTKIVVALSILVSLAVIATGITWFFNPEMIKPTQPTPSSSSPTETSPSSPTPTPSPTYRCTTATGPACTEDLAKREAARDKTIADAEAGYREFFSAYTEHLEGGGGPLSDELNRRTTEVTRPVLQDYMNKISDQNVYFTGDLKIEALNLSDKSPEWPTDDVEFDVCLNALDWRGLDQKTDTLVIAGRIAKGYVVMTQEKGMWKVKDNVQESADSC